MFFFKKKKQQWLGNQHTGAVHIVGRITNQCNVDDITAANWLPLPTVEALNEFLARPWHASGMHPHLCEHCVG